MSIETSPAPTANPKPSANAASHGARAAGKATPSADAAADSDSTGFRAILGAQDDAEAAPPLAASTDAVPADPGAAVPAPTPLDASTLLLHNPQIAAAQASQAVADAARARAKAAQAPALLAQTAVLGAAVPAVPLAPLTATLLTQTGTTAPALRVGDGSSKSAAPAAPAPLPQDVAESLTQGLQHANARAKAGKEALLAGADSGAAGSTAVAVGNERTEPNKFLAALEQAKAPPSARNLEPLLVPLLGKTEKQQVERSAAGLKNTEPTYGGSTLGVSAPDFSQSGALAPVLAPEMQVAEQVSYWVSHNVQNAELKLDGLGQSPVEVSISLQGNEAHISFRTDEVATRDVLQHAATHLKDMLQSEGLVLTGVSVGGSGSGNADSSERRARSAVRQVAIAPLQVASADSTPRLRSTSLGGAGRSVDLFV